MSKLWKVALLAFVAMCAQDVLSTVMVVFEANYNAVMAGVFDVAGWVAGLVCSALALESIIQNGWRNTRSLVLIAAVSLANFFGTVLGVALALALTHHH
jgi:hypothetical protein